jgi:hypothetical protein
VKWYEDETILWRCALPRRDWWRRAQRARLSLRPLSHGHIKAYTLRKSSPGGHKNYASANLIK